MNSKTFQLYDGKFKQLLKCLKLTQIISILILFLFISCNSRAKGDGILNFNAHEFSGVKVLEDYSGKPDSLGVFEQYKLKLPAFKNGVYYSAKWWPASSNRVYGNIITENTIGNVKQGGMFLLLQVSSDKYFALLPMVSEQAYSWLDSGIDGLLLKMGTHGKATLNGDIPLYSWAFASNPYLACNQAWEKALAVNPNTTTTREEKSYPEAFEYLGWCSWEHFKFDITETNMIQTIKDIEKSGVPVRSFLMDDGHFDRQSVLPGENFPNGYKPLTDLKKDDKIKWMGIWYAFLGDNHGIKLPGNLGELNSRMSKANAGILLPGDDGELATEFYDHFLDIAKHDNMDFVKVDFQTDPLVFYAGSKNKRATAGLPTNNLNAVDNPVKASVQLSKVFQQRVSKNSLSLTNCNWHHSISLFYSGESSVGRCSEDYQVGNKEKAKAHLYHSYAAMPWLGQIAWGDHDMFHSNDPFAGRMMAVSKAISGGPVFLSDVPNHFQVDNINPLCYADGKLLRPLAPAAPLPDDIFKDLKDESLYRTITPLKNSSVAVVVYNLSPSESSLSTTINSDFYTKASGMIQPYSGDWEIPSEGLLVYDWYKQTAQPLGEGYEVLIDGFEDRLIHLIPINNGWGVIGLQDKYLSPVTYTILKSTAESITIELEEEGSFLLWCKDKIPTSEGLIFENLGDNLWKVVLHERSNKRVIEIKVK